MWLLNGKRLSIIYLLFIFLTNDVHSERLFNPCFNSPKANYSSETMVDNQGGGVNWAG